jgi:hypothetical protein
LYDTAFGLDFGPDGKLYAAMMGRANVWQIDVATSTAAYLWDPSWAISQGFSTPRGIEVASNGDVYATGTSSIMKWDAATIAASAIVTGSAYTEATGLTIDESAGILYLVVGPVNKVVKYSTTGTYLGEVAALSAPVDVVFIPEPATMMLLGLGSLALLKRKRA